MPHCHFRRWLLTVEIIYRMSIIGENVRTVIYLEALTKPACERWPHEIGSGELQKGAKLKG
jgi:hypothetical protein